VPYTSNIQTKEEKAAYANIIGALRESKSMSATSTFKAVGGWWHQHAHGTNRSIERTRASCAILQAVEKKSRREAIKTAKIKQITAGALITPPLNCADGTTALPASLKALAAVGMDFAETRFDLQADEDGAWNEVDPTLADEEQFDGRRYPRRRWTAPDLGSGVQVADRSTCSCPTGEVTLMSVRLFKSATCPGRSNRGVIELPVARGKDPTKRPKSSVKLFH
jgi:hypothetical protein